MESITIIIIINIIIIIDEKFNKKKIAVYL